MAQEDLVKYILTLKQQGIHPDVIKENLVSAGWDAVSIESAFLTTESQNIQSPITNPTMAAHPVASLDGFQSYDGISGSELQLQKKGGKRFLLPVTIVLVTLVVSAVSFGYIFYYKPKSALASAFSKLSKTETAHLKLGINLKITDDSQQNAFLTGNTATGQFSLDGYFQSKEKEEQKSDFGFDGKVNLGVFAVEGKGGLKTFGNRNYFKIDKLTDFGMPEFLEITGKWFKMNDTSDLTQSKNEVDKPAQEELLKKLQDTKVYKKIERRSDEEVNGVGCYVFKFDVDKDKFRSVYNEYLQKTSDSPEKEVEDSNRFFDHLQTLKGTIYVSKAQNEIQKTNIEVDYKEDTVRMLLSTDVSVTEINKDHTFVEPTEAVPLNQAFGNQLQSNVLGATFTRED